MSQLVSPAKSHLASTQACDALRSADVRDWKQEWTKGKEEFRLKINGHTEYVIARDFAATIDSIYSMRVKNFGREESLSARFAEPLHRQLRETFDSIAALRVAQREQVGQAIETGVLLQHVRERNSYFVSTSQNGTLFTSELPDTGSGAILVRGDLSRDVSRPDKRLILEVTWRTAAGTGGPLACVVDSRYATLLPPK